MQHISLVTYNVQQANEAMNAHRDFLHSAHAYPLTTFPGHREENLLGQLMRKKLEPKVEDWIAEYTTKVEDRKGAASANGVSMGETEQGGGLTAEEARELWSWAGPTSNGVVKAMVEDGAFGDDFTLAEREAGVENVVTGLRRRLYDEDESEDEEGDEDKMMEDVMPVKPAEEPGIDPKQPPMQIERLLKFVSTGLMPT